MEFFILSTSHVASLSVQQVGQGATLFELKDQGSSEQPATREKSVRCAI